MLLIGIIGIGAAIGLAIYAFAAGAQDKAMVRSSLRSLEGYEIEDQREQVLANPLRDRALLPVMRSLTGVGKRFSPTGYVDGARRKLELAGLAAPSDVDRFMMKRVVSILMIVPLFIAMFVLGVGPLSGVTRVFVFGLLAAVCVFLPDARLSGKVEDRQMAIRRSLPDILDLLTISVEAGLGFDQALDRVVAAVPGPLSEEFERMLGETRAGSTRREAMIGLDERTGVAEVKSFVLAILQADTFGISIGRVLRSQAEEMRIKRRQLAQEVAQKAPVKMLIPMVFCIFPSLFVVVLAPAMINISRTL